MENLTATLYAIHECGFYSDDEYKFGNIREVFQDFIKWTEGLANIGESSTYEIDEDDDFLRSFCIDVRELAINDVYVVATWNELPRFDDGVQVLQVQSKVGHAAVQAVPIDAMSLPGYPAYYCIDARNRVSVNLRFEQRLNGSRQFQKYINGFLQGYSCWCVWDQEDDGSLLGYNNIDSSDYDDSLESKFSTSLYHKAGKIDHIRENVSRIRKVKRRAYVNPQVKEEKSFIDKSFELLGLPINNRLRAPMRYQFELKRHLTLDQLNGIIREFENRNAADAWSDTGFVFARESSKTYWLRKSIARESFSIDVKRSEDGHMIDIDSLVEYLNENFDKLVGFLRA